MKVLSVFLKWLTQLRYCQVWCYLTSRVITVRTFGIRIENLELVVDVETQGDMNVMGFESLTRAPIDKRLIEPALLTDVELAWLNNYHQTVFNVISPSLAGSDLEWLTQATSPLSR